MCIIIISCRYVLLVQIRLVQMQRANYFALALVLLSASPCDAASRGADLARPSPLTQRSIIYDVPRA